MGIEGCRRGGAMQSGGGSSTRMAAWVVVVLAAVGTSALPYVGQPGLGEGSGSGSGMVPRKLLPKAPLHGTTPAPPPPLWVPPDTPPGPSPSATKVRKPSKAPNYGEGHQDLEESPDNIDDAPDWAMGKGEKPQGIKHMGGWTMKVFTSEQQNRLHVNQYGQHKAGGLKGFGLGEKQAPSKKATSRDSISTKSLMHKLDDVNSVVQSAGDGAETGPADDPWPWRA